MKFLIILIALALLLVVGAEAKYSPPLEMGTNVITQLGNSSTAQGATPYSQVLDISRKSDPGVTVGFTPECDFQITTAYGAATAISNAANFVSTKYYGGDVKLMEGCYNFSTGIAELPCGVNLKGPVNMHGKQVAFFWAVTQTNSTKGYGAVFRIFNASPEIVKCNYPNGGNSIENIAFWYPLQATNSTPTAYAASINATGQNCKISGVLFYNSYTAIKTVSAGLQKVFVSECSGAPIYRGIDFGSANYMDVPKISDVQFCTAYNYNAGTKLAAWTAASGGPGIFIGDFAGGSITNCEIAGYPYGILIDKPSSQDETWITRNYLACHIPLYVLHGKNTYIFDNTIWALNWSFNTAAATNDGIILAYADGSRVEGNRITNVGHTPIRILYSPGTLVKNNQITYWGLWGDYSQGITLSHSPGTQILGNNLSGSSTFMHGQGIFVDADSDYVQINDNAGSRCPTYLVYLSAGVTGFMVNDNRANACNAGIIDDSGTAAGSKSVNGNLIIA